MNVCEICVICGKYLFFFISSKLISYSFSYGDVIIKFFYEIQ